MISHRQTVRRVDVCGPCPADEVWDRYLRPGRWPEWSPQIRSVDYAADVISPHTTGVVHGPAGMRVAFEIVEVSDSGPIRTWSWAVSAAGTRLHLRHDVEATPTGSRTLLTVRGVAPAVILYLPVARLALRRLVC